MMGCLDMKRGLPINKERILIPTGLSLSSLNRTGRVGKPLASLDQIDEESIRKH